MSNAMAQHVPLDYVFPFLFFRKHDVIEQGSVVVDHLLRFSFDVFSKCRGPASRYSLGKRFSGK